MADFCEYKNFTILRRTEGKILDLPFLEIKEKILGKEYNLSLVFPRQKYLRDLNKKWRKKNKETNILSFTLDKNNGEIFISLSRTRKEAKKFYRKYHEHLIFLFIHGCLHLKGLEHGAIMGGKELSLFKKFN